MGAANRVVQGLGMDNLGGALDVRLDLVCCHPNRVNTLHPLAEQIIQHGVVAAFVLATENQVNICGKGLERLDGGVDIRGLRVVVVLDALDGGHVFQAMLDCLEAADSLPNLVGRHTQQNSGTNACENVLHVMRALEANHAHQHNFSLPCSVAKEDSATFQVRPL